jgi:hypothetical protein
LRRLPFTILLVSVAWVAAACDDPLSLGPATDANFIDTVVVYALRGTSIDLPSGYDVVIRETARTDRADPFDFAFDLSAEGTALIYPRSALGLTRQSGVLVMDDEFAEIDEAPLEDYQLEAEVAVSAETVFVVRSRAESGGVVACPFFVGALPRYGKFRVVSIDATERSITLESLVNVNCGYRGLEPGIPTQ